MASQKMFNRLFAFVVAGLMTFPVFASDPKPPVNIKPALVLSQLDLEGGGADLSEPDGQNDNSPDSDGDGLPDNWEDRVPIFVPTAIGPGTPPTFVLSRLAVKTSRDAWDSDGDGLSDFIEVFGLKFIDDNGNGKLDFDFEDSNSNGHWDSGERIYSYSEWMDLNGDGLPSIGEFPLPNTDTTLRYRFMFVNEDGSVTPDDSEPEPNWVTQNRTHDFDGIMFTDPMSRDTDGDTKTDGADNDPLINPKTFGVSNSLLSFSRNVPGIAAEDTDLDNDGLGNGTDFADDDLRAIDYPAGFRDLVALFRPDLVKGQKVPEWLMEDLIGADWNGDGLWRITDIRVDPGWLNAGQLLVDKATMSKVVGPGNHDKFLKVGSRVLYADRGQYAGGQLATGSLQDHQDFGNRGLGFRVQAVLMPSDRESWCPDVRVWTILYAWRTPGFDVDGDGFVGDPQTNKDDPQTERDEMEDLQTFEPSGIADLDGVVEPTCGMLGSSLTLYSTMLSLVALRCFPSRKRFGR